MRRFHGLLVEPQMQADLRGGYWAVAESGSGVHRCGTGHHIVLLRAHWRCDFGENDFRKLTAIAGRQPGTWVEIGHDFVPDKVTEFLQGYSFASNRQGIGYPDRYRKR
jgi:hypothetical protein